MDVAAQADVVQQRVLRMATVAFKLGLQPVLPDADLQDALQGVDVAAHHELLGGAVLAVA